MTDKSKNVSQPKDYKLIVEKDVKIPMRDGAILYADVLRPDSGGERVPAIMNIGPYQKDRLWIPPRRPRGEGESAISRGRRRIRCGGVRAATRCVRVDARGSGKSPGKSDPSSYAEAVDFYDAIEWIAKLPWCSGNIGTLGISYHANCQWRVANLQPPSLKAIMPWEGRADLYRDQAYHGGIFAMGFFATLGRDQHGAPPHRPRAQLQPRRVQQQHAVELGVNRPRLRVLAPAQRAMGRRSRCRSTASATGPARGCTCAATPKAS